jgi:hypothetical protein
MFRRPTQPRATCFGGPDERVIFDLPRWLGSRCLLRMRDLRPIRRYHAGAQAGLLIPLGHNVLDLGWAASGTAIRGARLPPQ